jgi:hypothetical protein
MTPGVKSMTAGFKRRRAVLPGSVLALAVFGDDPRSVFRLANEDGWRQALAKLAALVEAG